MAVKLKSRLSDLERYFIEKYGNKKNFENLENYKFIHLLFEKAPNLEISEGLPNSLLADIWEVAYDIVGGLDISNTSLIEELIDFFEYISTNLPRLFWCIIYFIDELKEIGAEHIILPKFKPNTKKLWIEYIKSHE